MNTQPDLGPTIVYILSIVLQSLKSVNDGKKNSS